VLSAFGVQFAQRHDTTAAELVRVCRPGERIVVVNWTPDSGIAELLKTIGGYTPAPPAFASPPPLGAATTTCGRSWTAGSSG